MKTKYFKYLWFVVILGLFVFSMFTIRMKTKTDIQDKIYQKWEKHFVVKKGNEAYVKTTNDKDKDVVLSESQSYGMLITVRAAKKGLANQKDFERLYKYYLSHRIEGNQLMSWEQIVQKSAKNFDDHNATDGDLYIAYALIEASKQWPSHKDEYQKQAKALLQDILKYNYNENTGILTVGNWANKDSKYYNLMRTSDTVPKQFQAFYEVTKDKKWLDINNKMLSSLETISSKTKTGLIPDFIWVDESGARVVKPYTISNQFDSTYSYNACRLPYNLTQSNDEKSQKVLNKMLDFFMTQKNVFSNYNLSGKFLDDHQAASFKAPIAFAAEKDQKYLKLVQQNRIVFMQDLPVKNYYDSAIITLVAMEFF